VGYILLCLSTIVISNVGYQTLKGPSWSW